MPDPTPADLLAAYGGYPAYPDPSGGTIAPGDVLRAFGHVLAPGLVAPPEGLPTPPQKTARDYATELSAGKNKPPDPLETMLGVAGSPSGAPAMFIGPVGIRRLVEAGHPEYGQALAKAEQMLAAGAKPEEIYQATRIGEGPGISVQHGRLWAETPGLETGFKPEAQLPQIAEGKGGIKALMSNDPEYSPSLVVKPGMVGGTVADVWNDPMLFKAYPELTALPFHFKDPLPRPGYMNVGGLQYTPGKQNVSLNPEAFAPENMAEEMRQIVPHELQHGVQGIEKAPKGGNPRVTVVEEAAKAAITKRQQDLKAQIAALREQGQNSYDPEVRRLLLELGNTGGTEALRAEQYKQYFNLAGEAQARNVPYRMDMTPAELAAKDPSVTQDVPYAEQLLRLGDWPTFPMPKAPYRAPEQLKLDLSTQKRPTEMTPIGEQYVIPGAEQRTPADMAKRAAQQPLRPSVEQKPPGGMFEDQGGQGSLLSTYPSFSERMGEAKDVAFQRAQRGQTTGDYGLGSARRTAPDAPAGSFEDLAARQRAGFQGDKQRIIDEYRQATGQPVAGAERPLLAPGEEDLAFSTKLRGGGGPKDPFLHDPYPNAPFPQYADVYPPTGPPTMKPRGAGKEGTYPAKTLTPEAEAVAKARTKIMEDMEKGYQPFFDPSQRFPAEFAKQPGPHVDTAQAVAKRQETIAKHLETIGAPETLARLRAGYSRGLDLPDSQAWYLLGQVERKMIEDMGEAAGRKHFRDSFATAMSATTTNMTPPQNLIMAQYLNYLRKTGQPFPTAAYETPVAVGGQRTMPNIEAYQKAFSDPRGPYESLGLQNPKRTDFAQAQMGNPNAFTIDEQMGHGMLGVDVPQAGTYGLITKVGREEAARAGVDPQRYQDVGWAGFKKMLEEQSRAEKGFRPYGPGEGYQGKPMISEVNDMIERIHRLTGRPRADVWRKVFIEHSIPIYGLGGALTLGGVLQGQMGPAPPQ